MKVGCKVRMLVPDGDKSPWALGADVPERDAKAPEYYVDLAEVEISDETGKVRCRAVVVLDQRRKGHFKLSMSQKPVKEDAR